MAIVAVPCRHAYAWSQKGRLSSWPRGVDDESRAARPPRWWWRCRWNGPAPAHQKPPRTPQKSWIYRGSSFSAMYLAAAERPLAFIRLRSVRLGLGWAHTACRAPGQIRVPSSPATRSSSPVVEIDAPACMVAISSGWSRITMRDH
jgi:hypothetical protein